MRRNELELHIPQNRSHLLNSVIGNEITNVYRFFRNREKFEATHQIFHERSIGNLDLFSFASHEMLGIEFNKQINIDFSRFKGRFLVKEANTNGSKFTSIGWSQETFKLDLRTAFPAEHPLKQAIGKKIKKINIVHFPEKQRYASNGLEFVLEDYSSLVLGVIPPDFAHNSIQFYSPKSSFLQKLERVPIPSPRLKHLSIYKYKIGSKNDLTNMPLPFLEAPYSKDKTELYSLNTDQYAALFLKKPQENYRFLRGVLSSIFENQISILDMKFGFTLEGDLRIVSPVDVVKDFVFEYNVVFIQSLMETIRKHYSQSLF